VGEEKLMSQREAQRLAVLSEVIAGRMKVKQAGAALGLSERQVKRLTRRLRSEGGAGLISRKRGAPSNRRIAEETRERYMRLVREHYGDFGPTLACEYLQREHGFTHSVETLRSWMSADQMWKPKQRRQRRIHSPRPRRDCRGELVQIDGSHHDWFEGRAPKCCLIAFIDDATGEVLTGRFFGGETTQGYLTLLRQHASSHGLAAAYYSDRAGIFTKHDEDDSKPTQFARALLQLDIESICANTPQAKGRVERLFQTLQDRMVKAMRLQGISGIEAANAWLAGYLGEHNRHFAVPAASNADAHRPWLGTPEALARICAVHHQRHLSNQLSCQFRGDIIQVEPGQPQAPRGRALIDIVEHADGSIEVLHRGSVLKHRSFTVDEHLKTRQVVPAKEVNARVDDVLERQRRAIARVAASVAHQQDQRARGIRVAPAPANSPPREETAGAPARRRGEPVAAAAG
jgi:transposase